MNTAVTVSVGGSSAGFSDPDAEVTSDESLGQT